MNTLDFSVVDEMTEYELEQVLFFYWRKLREDERALRRFVADRRGKSTSLESGMRDQKCDDRRLQKKARYTARRLRGKDPRGILYEEQKNCPRNRQKELTVLFEKSKGFLIPPFLWNIFKEAVVNTEKRLAADCVPARVILSDNARWARYAWLLRWLRIVVALVKEQGFDVVTLVCAGIFWEDIWKKMLPKEEFQQKLLSRLRRFREKDLGEFACAQRVFALFSEEMGVRAIALAKENEELREVLMLIPEVLAVAKEESVDARFWNNTDWLLKEFVRGETTKIYGEE